MTQQTPHKSTDQYSGEKPDDTAVKPIEKEELSQQSVRAAFEEFGPKWIYDNIQEAAVNCRKLLIFYLLLLSYAFLSTLTAPVQNLFLGQIVTMPIIKFSIPLNQYLLLTPLIVIGFFVYIQIYLRKVNKMAIFAIEKCRREHPGECDLIDPKQSECSFNEICVQLQSRFYPWMFIYSRYSHETIIKSLQWFFFICSLWFFLPITLFAISLFIVKTHNSWHFYSLLMMMVIGDLIVYFFWRFQLHPDFTFKIDFIKINIIKKRHFSLFALILALMAVLIALHIQGQNGHLWWIKDNVWNEEAGVYTRFMRSFIFPDLRDKHLVSEEGNDQAFQLVLRKVHFEGANLSNAYLANSNLAKAQLQKANLHKVNLKNSDLYKANLNHSDLGESELEETKLIGAEMNGCDLVQANLKKADLTDANLRYADLRNADLDNTTIYHTDIYFADFRGAENIDRKQIEGARNWQFAYYDPIVFQRLGLPRNHNENLDKKLLYYYPLSQIEIEDLSGFDLTMSILSEANLRGADLKETIFQNADLSKADLTGADFEGADLTSAVFDDANVQGANFQGVKGLTITAIKKAKAYPLAFYGSEIISQLELKPNHNERLMEKNLREYDFSKFKGQMEGADFSGMNLKSSMFQKLELNYVVFENTRLNGAKFDEAKLQNANFREADLDGCTLDGANIRWADFRSAKNLSIEQIKTAHGYQLAKYDIILLKKLGLPENHNELIKKRILYKSNLHSAKLKEANFIIFDMRNAILVKADLTDSTFDQAVLRGADLSNSILVRASFRETDLTDAKFNAANLTGAELEDANLQYADMRGVKGLTTEKLEKASNYHLAKYSQNLLRKLELKPDHNRRLEEKNLQNYKLNGAPLKRANLMGFDLAKSDLSDANLQWANLHGANLLGANLQNTDFRNATLRDIVDPNDKNAVDQVVDQFANVKSLFQAKIDPELKKKLETAHPSLFENPDLAMFSNMEWPSGVP